ncbi:hypothetical protein [Actinomadura rubrisoli]|uniref:Uncharacterized protein n=1 Tax=Actinomadura rubrisoli TaxID=2530368 RepID=A0A4R5A355_9ACTN|nr:hypothetical protein [Actinomadura rubrisoli]TDD65104.1 hypothetical protein E1298_41685 [Actinomadura rubrisoli]
MTDVPEIFARSSGTLADIISAVRRALDTDPDACRSQDDRLRAWCAATTQFLDAEYWAAALDVHAAHKRAQTLDATHKRAALQAQEAGTAHAAAHRDATERAAHLGVTHPKPHL